MSFRSRLDRFPDWVHGHSLGRVVILVIVGVVVFAAAVVQILGYFDPPDGPSSSGSPVSAPTATTAETAAPDPPASSQPADEQCLTVALVDVQCRELHRYQSMAGPCDVGGLVRFMGGLVGADVAAADPRTEIVKNKCVIDFAHDVEGSAEGVLKSAADDSWRQCVDDRDHRLVNCNQLHTGEYFATGRMGRADLDECEASGHDYLGQDLDAVQVLRVTVLASVSPDPNGARCLVSVRNTQLLTASVAHLGVNAVPLQR
jgi:hypothetical protein